MTLEKPIKKHKKSRKESQASCQTHSNPAWKEIDDKIDAVYDEMMVMLIKKYKSFHAPKTYHELFSQYRDRAIKEIEREIKGIKNE